MRNLQPRLQELHTYWLKRHSGGSPPRASTIPATELVPWLSSLIFIRASGQGQRYEVLCAGADAVFALGRDPTGDDATDLDGPTLRGPAGRIFDAAMNGEPAVLRGASMRREAMPGVFERLVLPLADDQGRVAYLLMARSPIAAGVAP